MGTLRIVGRRGIMREKNKQIWIYVLLILGAIIMIIPFGWMIIVAFTKPDITYQMTLSNVINSLSLDHFRSLFTEYNILRYAANSIIVSVVSTAGQILICAMSGFVFARIDFKHKEKIFILYLATMMIPVQATVIPQYILINKMGLINTYAGLFLPGLFNAFGTFLMRQYFMGVPKALEEAACLDGAGYIRPLINDFLRKMAKFRHQENQDVSAGTRIRFFIDKPAAMISFPRAVIKYL